MQMLSSLCAFGDGADRRESPQWSENTPEYPASETQSEKNKTKQNKKTKKRPTQRLVTLHYIVNITEQ